MFKKNPLFLFALILVAGFLSHCQAPTENVQENEIRASFYVRYLADALQLKGQATFFQSDSTVLKIPTGVAFMGSGSKEQELPGQLTRYESNLQTPFQSDLRFNFKLPGNEELSEVKLNMSGLPGFRVVESSKSSGLKLELDGELAANETLLLLFTDPNQEARTVLRPGPLTQDQLFVPAEGLQHFIPGEYRLYLVKQTEQTGQGTGFEYSFSVEYYTAEEAFTLME